MVCRLQCMILVCDSGVYNRVVELTNLSDHRFGWKKYPNIYLVSRCTIQDTAVPTRLTPCIGYRSRYYSAIKLVVRRLLRAAGEQAPGSPPGKAAGCKNIAIYARISARKPSNKVLLNASRTSKKNDGVCREVLGPAMLRRSNELIRHTSSSIATHRSTDKTERNIPIYIRYRWPCALSAPRRFLYVFFCVVG